MSDDWSNMMERLELTNLRFADDIDELAEEDLELEALFESLDKK